MMRPARPGCPTGLLRTARSTVQTPGRLAGAEATAAPFLASISPILAGKCCVSRLRSSCESRQKRPASKPRPGRGDRSRARALPASVRRRIRERESRPMAQVMSWSVSSHFTVRPSRYERTAIWQAMALRNPISNGQLGSFRLRTQSKKFCMCASVASE